MKELRCFDALPSIVESFIPKLVNGFSLSQSGKEETK